jgi:hypothetical protein
MGQSEFVSECDRCGDVLQQGGKSIGIGHG